MKRLVLSSLSVLLFASAAAPAFAQATPAEPPANAATIGMAVNPFNLVFLAYQGFFESEGIPKFNALVSAHQNGQVTAADLVRVAVGMRRLPESALNDRSFIDAVNRQLTAIDTNDH